MLVAHFTGRGAGSVDLPTWTVAYVVLAALVVVTLWTRTTFIPRRESETSTPRVTSESDVSVSRATGWLWTGLQVLAAVVFVTLILVAFTGHDTIGTNIAPIAVMGVYWALGGWLALVFGPVWQRTNPFRLLTRFRLADKDARPRPVLPWWSSLVVLSAFVLVWVAWPEGDEPRHLGWWLIAYALVMGVAALLGGNAAISRVEGVPRVLDFPAWIVPTRRRPGLDDTRDSARATTWCAIIVLSAIAADRVTTNGWYVDAFETASQPTLVAVNLWMIALFAGGLGIIWWLALLPVRRVRAALGAPDASGTLGATALGAMTGGVLLAAGLLTGLIQAQNLAVLASDPLSRGWNLFGTVYWEVSQAPISARSAGLVQVAAVLGGHAGALVHLARSATTCEGGQLGTARDRLRVWTAALPAMGLALVGGVVWTLVLLGS